MSTSPNDARLDGSDAKTSSEINPAQLIEDHQAGVWRYLRILGCQSSEADDLTQETFLAVLRKPFEYYNKAAAASYLRKVAYHRFISARRRTRKEIVVAELELVDQTWSKWIGQDDGSEVLETLSDCLGQLTKRARWALEMRFRDKLPRAEIAEHLSITEHGAKNLMQRAKKKLKACIDEKMT